MEDKTLNKLTHKFSKLIKSFGNVKGGVIISKDSFIKIGEVKDEDLEVISRHIVVVMGSSEMLYRRFKDEVEYIEIKGKKYKTILFNLGKYICAIVGDVNPEEIKEEIINIGKSSIEELIEEVAF